MEAGDLSNAFAKIPGTKTANGVLLWLPLLENLVHLSTLQQECAANFYQLFLPLEEVLVHQRNPIPNSLLVSI